MTGSELLLKMQGARARQDDAYRAWNKVRRGIAAGVEDDLRRAYTKASSEYRAAAQAYRQYQKK